MKAAYENTEHIKAAGRVRILKLRVVVVVRSLHARHLAYLFHRHLTHYKESVNYLRSTGIDLTGIGIRRLGLA